MKFETLKKDNKKKIAIITIAVISVTLVGILATTFAKYRLTQSIPLANGTINYKAYDFKIMAMYQQKDESTCTEDSCYDAINTMPESGYAINESKSYCTLDNKNKDSNAVLKTVNGIHSFSNLSKQDKCYLYFDKDNDNANIASNTIIGGITVKEPTFISAVSTDEGTFKAEDNDGISYYWRGAVTNNYLKFANFWWRIIRINGDGTIRIIYDGTEYHANGTSTTDSQIGKSAFNSNTSSAVYVGFKYGTTSEARGLTNKSTILTALETWYTENLTSYASKIDTNAGFCGDRTAYRDSNGTTAGTGYGTSTQYFADHVRLQTNKVAVLTCANELDLYTVSGALKGNKSLTYPIGLINANEATMTGLRPGYYDSSCYLCNGHEYWTMSPSHYAYTSVMTVTFNGTISANSTNQNLGVRPVINLRADVQITGSGTENDPFVVS